MSIEVVEYAWRCVCGALNDLKPGKDPQVCGGCRFDVPAERFEKVYSLYDLADYPQKWIVGVAGDNTQELINITQRARSAIRRALGGGS
jgi:hypothetical protein